MRKFSIVIAHTQVVTYEQIEEVEANDVNEAKDLALERDLLFGEPSYSECEDVRIVAMTEIK